MENFKAEPDFGRAKAEKGEPNRAKKCPAIFSKKVLTIRVHNVISNQNMSILQIIAIT
jgi:hypothetical protein